MAADDIGNPIQRVLVGCERPFLRHDVNFARKGVRLRDGYCGVSSYRIRRLGETGLIDAEFSGKKWQIPPSEIERLERDGVPSAPRIVDSDDVEASRTPNAKGRAGGHVACRSIARNCSTWSFLVFRKVLAHKYMCYGFVNI
jgi:hypothetical protein